MNRVVLIGRVVKEPNVYISESEDKILYMVLAVKKSYKDSENVDFILCKAFGDTASNLEKIAYKGLKLSVVGKLRTKSYTDDDGNKVYSAAVHIDEFEIVEHTKEYLETINNRPEGLEKSEGLEGFESFGDGFFKVPDYVVPFLEPIDVFDDELPFR